MKGQYHKGSRSAFNKLRVDQGSALWGPFIILTISGTDNLRTRFNTLVYEIWGIIYKTGLHLSFFKAIVGGTLQRKSLFRMVNEV